MIAKKKVCAYAHTLLVSLFALFGGGEEDSPQDIPAGSQHAHDLNPRPEGVEHPDHEPVEARGADDREDYQQRHTGPQQPFRATAKQFEKTVHALLLARATRGL